MPRAADEVIMPGVRRTLAILLGLVAAALPAAASAREATITSADGTQIVLDYFPAPGDGPHPTVLQGPGFGSPGTSDPDAASQYELATIGLGPLRRAGYNVVTWDPRGFWQSGGLAQFDVATAEGIDVQAILDYVAGQPESELDAAGDPRVGMTGGSYGGGIQLVTAAIDPRVDAIVPALAWHSLVSSLNPHGNFRATWYSLLFAGGRSTSRVDPHFDTIAAMGNANGSISPADQAWLESRGPGRSASAVGVPTLLVQGTVDTLFPLDEAVANYEAIRAAGTPVSMLWYCGGHGSCFTPAGDPGRVPEATLQWLARYLKKDASATPVPGFEWIDQRGQTHTAAAYPPPPGAPLTGTGGGSLPLLANGGTGPSRSGGNGLFSTLAAPTNGTRAANAVNVAVTADRPALVTGAPQLTLRYAGTTAATYTWLYGQVVDEATNDVLGNLVTPIPVVLDGAEHTVSLPLEIVTADLRAGDTLTVQVTSASSAFSRQGGSGTVDLREVSVSLPTVSGPAAAVQPALGPIRRLGRRVGAAAR